MANVWKSRLSWLLLPLLIFIIIMILVPPIWFGVRISISNVQLNHILYDSSASQLNKENQLRLAALLLPVKGSSTSITAKSQHFALFHVDQLRKHSALNQKILTSADLRYVLALPAEPNWPSFVMPSNLALHGTELVVPFDKRWNIRSQRERFNGTWISNPDMKTSLIRSDLLQATVDNTSVYQLIMLTWDAYTANGPFSAISFDVRLLKDTDLGIVVRTGRNESFQVPVEIFPEQWTTIVIPFPHNGTIQHIDFYLTDMNRREEGEFGIFLENGIFQ